LQREVPTSDDKTAPDESTTVHYSLQPLDTFNISLHHDLIRLSKFLLYVRKYGIDLLNDVVQRMKYSINPEMAAIDQAKQQETGADALSNQIDDMNIDMSSPAASPPPQTQPNNATRISPQAPAKSTPQHAPQQQSPAAQQLQKKQQAPKRKVPPSSAPATNGETTTAAQQQNGNKQKSSSPSPSAPAPKKQKKQAAESNNTTLDTSPDLSTVVTQHTADEVAQ